MSKLAVFVSAIALLLGIFSLYIAQPPLTVNQIEGVRSNNLKSAGGEPASSAHVIVTPQHAPEWCDGWQAGWQEAAAKVWYYRNAHRALYGQPSETPEEARARIIKSVPALPSLRTTDPNSWTQQEINNMLGSVDVYITLHFDYPQKAEGCK